MSNSPTDTQTQQFQDVDAQVDTNLNLIEKYLSYTDDWYFYATNGYEYNDMFMVSMSFKKNGKVDCIISAAGRDTAGNYYPTYALSYHEGSYIVDKDTISIKLEDKEDFSVFCLDPDTSTLVQISEKGIFQNHNIGDKFTIIKGKVGEKSVEELRELLE